ncbi:MAG: acetyl-CoA carboxylase, carboxyltransferase subunit beta [Firmicutes bacterium]|nr:acetyl-CoA carboxylase, carboxyltransferase subunit beta [Bacillota bacterium]
MISLRDLFRKPKNRPENQGADGNSPKAPDGLYTKCDGCKRSIFTEELMLNQSVCPDCFFHFKISARRRLEFLVDKDSFIETNSDLKGKDILSFPSYEEKLKEAVKKCGENEAVITGTAKIDGLEFGIFIMESRFMMGSMGSAVGEKITRIFEDALIKKIPVIGFCLSGGARMQEGIISLMQMAKTSAAINKHSEAGLLYISVLTDPTTGGVTASFAMLGDIILAEPGALIGFAGPRVIEQTLRQKLPDGFQKAEFLLKGGFVDSIIKRTEQREKIGQLLKLHVEEDNESN